MNKTFNKKLLMITAIILIIAVSFIIFKTGNSSYDFSLGSAGLPEGNTVIYSVFVSTDDYSWDFTSEKDQKTKENSLNYLSIALDWLVQQAANYGKELSFTYDYTRDSSLYYETNINYSFSSNEYIDENIWEYIDTSVLSLKETQKKYNADNIIYLIFINTPDSFDQTSNTRNYYEDMPYPYEFCSIYVHNYNTEEFPAAYAHEILHTFGAPDLYLSDEGQGWNYNITGEYIAYCEKNHSNEIMLTVYDEDSGEVYYDKITNVLTDITAYYIGWINECADVYQFNLLPSEHISD